MFWADEAKEKKETTIEKRRRQWLESRRHEALMQLQLHGVVSAENNERINV